MNNKYLSVEGHPHLVRDVQSNAIINTDDYAHKSYLNSRMSKKRELNLINDLENQVSDLKNDINNVKSDISEIKDLLTKIANGS